MEWSSLLQGNDTYRKGWRFAAMRTETQYQKSIIMQHSSLRRKRMEERDQKASVVFWLIFPNTRWNRMMWLLANISFKNQKWTQLCKYDIITKPPHWISSLRNSKKRTASYHLKCKNPSNYMIFQSRGKNLWRSEYDSSTNWRRQRRCVCVIVILSF